MDDRLMLAGMMMAQEEIRVDRVTDRPEAYKAMARDAFDRADALLLEYRNRLHNPAPKDVGNGAGE